MVCGLLRFARNDEGGEWGFMDCFVVSLLAMTVYTNSSLREFVELVAISFILGLSLQGFEKAVAISVWQTLRPIKRLSLREPKVRGNLGMRDNYSFMEFFLFFVFVLTFCSCGLLRFARNDEGGEWEFMDCFVVSLLAMTKKRTVIAKAEGLWQS